MRVLMLGIAATALNGCVVYTVASTAVSVTATAIETTANVVGAGVGLVVGDGEDD